MGLAAALAALLALRLSAAGRLSFGRAPGRGAGRSSNANGPPSWRPSRTPRSYEVAYTNVQGERWRYPLEKMLQHVANHSTYHRGPVVTLLRQLGARAPGIDLLLFLDETSDTRG